MKKRITNFWVVLLITGIWITNAPLIAQSKFGTTAAQFLGIGIGARSIAMGGAFAAQSDDISALYWNPAGIAKIDRVQVGFNHSQWLVNTSINSAGASLPAGGFGTFGVFVTSLDYGKMEVTTIDLEDGTGEQFGASDLVAQITWAKELTDQFSIGISAKLINQTIYRTSAQGIAIDVGFLFDTGLLPNGLRLGASVTNFGSKMRLEGEGLTVNYDQTGGSESGVNSNVPARLVTDGFDLPLNFRIGTAYDLIRNDATRWTLVMDTNIPNDNAQSLSFGTEYAWKNILFLRAGYNALFEEESEKGLTVGAGIRYELNGFAIRFDYTYQTYGRLNAPQWFAIGMEF
ncbi:MAG: PorV/PorQ family protein [Chloroherpetonaceae bacterium]|nr:PorV/PorQ family protein [Chloroherpetonaceae bacterium]